MPLTTQEKLNIMKQAYSENYKGKFTDLFREADPDWDQDPTLAQPETSHMPELSNLKSIPQPEDAMPNAPTIPTGPGTNDQGLVQSYQAAPPSETPKGDDISTVIEAPSEYKSGGYKHNPLTEETENDYDSTSNPNAYINNYTNNYMYTYDEGGKKLDKMGRPVEIRSINRSVFTHPVDGTKVVMPTVPNIKKDKKK